MIGKLSLTKLWFSTHVIKELSFALNTNQKAHPISLNMLSIHRHVIKSKMSIRRLMCSNKNTKTHTIDTKVFSRLHPESHSTRLWIPYKRVGQQTLSAQQTASRKYKCLKKKLIRCRSCCRASMNNLKIHKRRHHD